MVVASLCPEAPPFDLRAGPPLCSVCDAMRGLPEIAPISRCGVLSGLELHPAPTCTPPMHRESWEWGPDQSEKRKMEGVLTQFDALIVEGPHR
jgi:hypothetical protein